MFVVTGALMLLIVWPSAALAQTGAITEPQLTPPEQLWMRTARDFPTCVCGTSRSRCAWHPGRGMTPKQLAKLGAKGENCESYPIRQSQSICPYALLCAAQIAVSEKITPANLGAVTLQKSDLFGANCIEITDLRFLAGLNDLRDVWISQCQQGYLRCNGYAPLSNSA
jgi:hypothetical protein